MARGAGARVGAGRSTPSRRATDSRTARSPGICRSSRSACSDCADCGSRCRGRCRSIRRRLWRRARRRQKGRHRVRKAKAGGGRSRPPTVRGKPHRSRAVRRPGHPPAAPPSRTAPRVSTQAPPPAAARVLPAALTDVQSTGRLGCACAPLYIRPLAPAAALRAPLRRGAAVNAVPEPSFSLPLTLAGLALPRRTRGKRR